MSLNFDSGAEEAISIADITAARFLINSDWSILAFFRIEDSAIDDRNIFNKWGPAASSRQFAVRTDQDATPPTRIEVNTNATTPSIATGSVVVLDTWYCVAVTNNSTGGATDLKVYLIDMAGTVIASGSGHHDGDAAVLTQSLRMGLSSTNSDEMDGDIDYTCYIQQELTQGQVIAYSQNPYRVAMSLQTSGGNVVFFNKLGLGGINCIDLSGQGRIWTVPGTLVVSNPPPVAPLFAWDVVAAFGGAPPAIDNNKLALMEWCIPWEPGLPVTSVAFDQGDRQQLLWGYPDVLWGAPVGDVTVTPSALSLSGTIETSIPEIRKLPSTFALTGVVESSVPEVITLPDALTASLTIESVTPSVLVAPDAIALVLTIEDPAVVLPDVTILASTLTLSLSLETSVPEVRLFPSEQTLNMTLETVLEKLTILPSALNLTLSVPSPTVTGVIAVGNKPLWYLRRRRGRGG